MSLQAPDSNSSAKEFLPSPSKVTALPFSHLKDRKRKQRTRRASYQVGQEAAPHSGRSGRGAHRRGAQVPPSSLPPRRALHPSTALVYSLLSRPRPYYTGSANPREPCAAGHHATDDGNCSRQQLGNMRGPRPPSPGPACASGISLTGAAGADFLPAPWLTRTPGKWARPRSSAGGRASHTRARPTRSRHLQRAFHLLCWSLLGAAGLRKALARHHEPRWSLPAGRRPASQQ